MKTLTGRLIEAGDKDGIGVPVVVFEVTRDQLLGWSLPLYSDSLITIVDAPRPDPLAGHPDLFRP